MRSNSAHEVFPKRVRPQEVRSSWGASSHKQRASRPGMPSTAGYMAAASVAAAILFFALWWMLHGNGDEAPWVPAGLAASVVMLVAAAAREVVMRRAWTRYILESDKHEHAESSARKRRPSNGRPATDAHANALRALQKKSTEANASGAVPEAHLEVYQSCKEFLLNTEEALLSVSTTSERGLAMRAGQERVRALQKHHLMLWASGSARVLTHEAQRRVRSSDKIETAMRALDVIDSALKVYPGEAELQESAAAVREFVASVKVAHWVELAERAAFKGHHARAIDRYGDALFYLVRGDMRDQARAEMAEKIRREIENLRARIKVSERSAKAASKISREPDREKRSSD